MPVSILTKPKIATHFSVQLSNNIFNKRLIIGLGGCCLRTDGQNVESFLKAIFMNTSADKIPAHFPHGFHSSAREFLSEDTKRSNTMNRN